MFLATKKFFEKQTQKWLNKDAPNRDQLQTGHQVFFWEKNFGQTTWKGPFEIIQTKPHKIRIDLGNNKSRWLLNNRVALDPGNFQNGDAAQAIGQPTDLQAIASILQQENAKLENLINFQKRKIQASQLLINSLQDANQELMPQPINQAAINAIQDEDARTQDYIRALALRIYSSHRPVSEAFTPQELDTWSRYSVQEINEWLSGHPLYTPEWRTSLCRFVDNSTKPQFDPGDLPVHQPAAQAVPHQASVPGAATTPKPPVKMERKPSMIRSLKKAVSKNTRKLTSRFTKKNPDSNNNFAGSGTSFRSYLGTDPGGSGVVSFD